MKIELSKYTPEYVSTIRELAQSIWWKHYPDIIGEKQVTYMLEKMYSIEVLNEHITKGSQVFYLIKHHEENCGFVAIERKSENELFLQKFYILQSTQNKGIGTIAFENLLRLYPKVSTIRLQVNRENIKPINFYFKLGFKIEKSANFDIGDGYFMNDFVMIKTINQNP